MNETKILSPHRSKISDYCEFGAMALLLVVGCVQIAGAFSASGGMIKSDAPSAALVQSHGGTMLAKK
jgi:hypothetical protein